MVSEAVCFGVSLVIHRCGYVLGSDLSRAALMTGNDEIDDEVDVDVGAEFTWKQIPT